MTVTQIEFLNERDYVLAATPAPDELFVEGVDQEIKTFDIEAKCKASGKLTRYRLIAPTGEIEHGPIIEGLDPLPFSRHKRSSAEIKANKNIYGPLVLNRVNVLTGDRIAVTLRMLTEKDEDDTEAQGGNATESEAEGDVLLEDGSGSLKAESDN